MHARLILLVALAGTSPVLGRTVRTKDTESTRPGLGEIMGVIQQHHLKLYFAGAAQNWPLAIYELGEIREGLEDAVKLYDHFASAKEPLSKLVRPVTKELDSIEQSLNRKAKAEFLNRFDELNAACNSCHSAANHGFIVIQTPRQAEFSNQRYEP